MRRFLILTTVYFVLGLTSSCFLKYDAFICDIDFAGLNSVSKNNESPDTFEDRIGFELISIRSSESCYIQNINLFNTAYATTKCAVFQNEILKSSYKIRLNRQILLNSDTIPKNTDLLAIPEVINSTLIEINEECKFVTSTIIFNNALKESLAFETGEYEVQFECKTSDNRQFTKTRTVIFKE